MAARDISHLRCDLLEYSCGYQQSNGKMRLEGRSKKNFPDSPMKIEIVQSTLDNCLVSGSSRIILLRLEANGSEQTLESIPVESLCHKTAEMVNSSKSRGQKLAPFEYPMSASQGHSFVSLRFWKEGDKNKRRVIEMILSNPDVLKIVQYLRRIECPIIEKPTSRASSSQGTGFANVNSDQRPPSQTSFHSTSHQASSTSLDRSVYMHSSEARQSAPANFHPLVAPSPQVLPAVRPPFGSSASSMNALEQQPYTALGSRTGPVATNASVSDTITTNVSHDLIERPVSVASAIRPNDIEQMFPDRLSSSGRNDSRGTISREGPVAVDRNLSRPIPSQAISINQVPSDQTSYATTEGARPSSIHGIDRLVSSQSNPHPLKSMEIHAYPTPAGSDQHYRPASSNDSLMHAPPRQTMAHPEPSPRLPYGTNGRQTNQSTAHSHSIMHQESLHPATNTNIPLSMTDAPSHTPTTPVAATIAQHQQQQQTSSIQPPPTISNNNQITNLKDFFNLAQTDREQIYLACQALYDSDESSRSHATRTLTLIQLSSPDFLQLLENMNGVFEKHGVGSMSHTTNR